MGCHTPEGVDEGAAFRVGDPADLGEGGGDVIGQHHIGAHRPTLGDAERAGIGRHHHLGVAVGGARGEGGGDGVIAGADGGDAAGALIGAQGQDIVQRAATSAAGQSITGVSTICAAIRARTWSIASGRGNSGKDKMALPDGEGVSR